MMTLRDKNFVMFVCFVLLHALLIGRSFAQETSPKPIVVISDLHFNVGFFKGESWHPLEDFRWPRAFDGFLDRLSSEFPNGVDLVIAGDFLELWQHPTLPCAKLSDTECGCSIDEMKQFVSDVINGHSQEFAAFGRFLSHERNRVYVTPGNHDAALMEGEIWNLVQQAVPQGKERFLRIATGSWVSADGQVVVEHGHQQTYDVNYFPAWPKVTKDCDGTQRFYRPWGENFVQTLYSEVEGRLPLIDNLVPESLGVKLYSEYRRQEGKGKRTADIARFIVFNVLQTSLRQKLGFLEVHRDRGTLTKRDVEFCRRCMGEQLLVWTLPSDDPMRKELEQPAANKPATPEPADSLKAAMREQVFQLDDESLHALCERAVLLNEKLEANPELADGPGCTGSLGMIKNKIFDPDGTHILKQRVSTLKRSSPALTLYVFGHTHEAKLRMRVETDDGTKIYAYNTGAFQRLMDGDAFTVKASKYKNRFEALQNLTHNDMAACYSVVFVAFPNNVPTAELKQWYMDETPDSMGKFLAACDSQCSARPGNCPKE